MSRRVVVTGAAGYLGRQLARRLAASYDVLGLDVPPSLPDLRPLAASFYHHCQQ